MRPRPGPNRAVPAATRDVPHPGVRAPGGRVSGRVRDSPGRCRAVGHGTRRRADSGQGVSPLPAVQQDSAQEHPRQHPTAHQIGGADQRQVLGGAARTGLQMLQQAPAARGGQAPAHQLREHRRIFGALPRRRTQRIVGEIPFPEAFAGPHGGLGDGVGRHLQLRRQLARRTPFHIQTPQDGAPARGQILIGAGDDAGLLAAAHHGLGGLRQRQRLRGLRILRGGAAAALAHHRGDRSHQVPQEGPTGPSAVGEHPEDAHEGLGDGVLGLLRVRAGASGDPHRGARMALIQPLGHTGRVLRVPAQQRLVLLRRLRPLGRAARRVFRLHHETFTPDIPRACPPGSRPDNLRPGWARKHRIERRKSRHRMLVTAA